jgi:prolyl oligopeptidase
MQDVIRKIAAVALVAALVGATGSHAADPFLWLEVKDGAQAMAWVKAENAKTLAVLQADPHYAARYADALAIAQSKDRIPLPSFIRGDLFNFWQDETHARGIWRMTTPASYATDSPAWTTVLDLDALAKSENANWVWEGAQCNWPAERRCLISLSDGGEDAVSVREFDLTTNAFVPNGFVLPRGKQSAVWESPDALLVAREWKPGDLTTSGYPFIVKRVARGAPLSSAVEIFRGSRTDVATNPTVLDDGAGHHATLIVRGVDFFNSEVYLETPHGLQRLALPPKVQVQALVDGRLIFEIDQSATIDGVPIPDGALIAVSLARALSQPGHLKPAVVFAPGPRQSIGEVGTTKNDLILTMYDDVKGRAFVYSPQAGDTWTQRQIALPDDASVTLVDRAFLSVRSFLVPTTLWSVDAHAATAATVKALPSQFDASKDTVDQHEATSKDGTKIPYFVVHPIGMQLNGTNPTVLNAYGGFQVSMTPFYSGILGKLWLEPGGVFVLANIRGGGEFGPAWHEAGLKTHRQRIYDDFYAVAQDLVTRKITSPRYLGIEGGSNGGLLMGVEFTQHPEMWNAVDIQIPLLDMLRYEQIQAGASWVGEYGSVSVPEERAFLASISPYNNLKPGVTYPEPFVWTTTKDDRVGPQHARKFAAKMASMGIPYLFYEVTEGGHGAGANLKERAQTSALEWTYFAMKLMQ